MQVDPFSPPFSLRDGLVRVAFPILFLLTVTLAIGCTRAGSHPPFSLSPTTCPTGSPSEAEMEGFLLASTTQLATFTSANSALIREIRNARNSRAKSLAKTHERTEEHIVWEQGDRFPTLLVNTHSAAPTRVRLDPFLRKAHLSRISRIAISPDGVIIALSAQDVESLEPRLIIIDHTRNQFEIYSLAAYDLLWSDDQTLLVSVLQNEQPTQIYQLTRSQPPKLIMTATNPGESLLLSGSRDRSLFVIEQASPTNSTLHLFTSGSATQAAWTLANQPPGSRCSSWRGSPVCILFADSPYGQVIHFNGAQGQQRTVLFTGDMQNIPENIDADETHLAIFVRQGTRTTLRIHSDSKSTPHIIESDGPVTTLLPAPHFGTRTSLSVRRRSFLKETNTLSISELAHAARASQALDERACRDCAEVSAEATSIDGVSIPISLVRPANAHGLLIMAYGAYGVSLAAEHSMLYDSLLASGIAVAIAHVRGGGEHGPRWHTQAVAENKILAAHDLLSVVTSLQKQLGVSPQATFLSGRSAGGWLVTKAAMLSPQSIAGIILDAPLLDLSAAVSNQGLPLYHTEVAEWGKQPSHTLVVSPGLTITRLPYDVLISLPLKDQLISPTQTARWAMAARCAQQPGATLIIKQLTKAGHAGTDSRSDANEWDVLQEVFIRRSIGS